MSAEFNKVLCAVLTAILVLLLSSFIGELLYHPKISDEKVSYVVEEEKTDEVDLLEDETNETSSISEEEIEQLLTKANLDSGEKFSKKL